MKEYYHIDMSGRLYEAGTSGIACVSSIDKTNHIGCALSSELKRRIEKKLCIGNIHQDYARIYAICIYYIIKNKLKDIETLVICNDEDFAYVKAYLQILLHDYPIIPKIINITEYQRELGRKVKSLADNAARAYRKRGLYKLKWAVGKKLDVVEISLDMIRKSWELIK